MFSEFKFPFRNPGFISMMVVKFVDPNSVERNGDWNVVLKFLGKNYLFGYKHVRTYLHFQDFQHPGFHVGKYASDI